MALGPTVRLTFAGDATDLERAMGRAGAAAGDMEQTFSAKSAAMVAAGAGLGAGLMSSFNESLEFESAGALLDAQLGAGSPLAAAAGEAAGSLYANAYGESLGEVNEAVRAVSQGIGGMSTASAADLESVTGKVMSLAQIMGVDAVAAANAVGQMMKTGLAPDAETAMDIITAGFQQGGDKAGDLLDTMNEYGTQFRKFGLDGQTATGLLTQGLQAGARDADIVADAIKEFSIRAIDGSESTAAGFDAIGLSASDMAAQIAQGGPTASAALDLTLDKLRAIEDPTARSAAAVQLFGTQAEDLGDALFALDPSEATAALGDFAGAAALADETLGATGAAKVEAMTRGFQEWAQSIAGIEGPLGTAAAGVMSFGGEAVGLAGSAGMAAMALRGLGIGSAIATAAQWAWNAALSANPIGLVVLAIAGLVAGLVWAYNSSETFRNVVNGAFGAVRSFVGSAVERVKGILGWFGSLPGLAAQWFGGLRDGAVRKGSELIGFVAGLPGRVMGAIGSFGSMLLGAGGDLISGLWRGIQNAAGWLRSRVFGFFGGLLPGWAKQILGIRSPSRVFAELGRYIPAGMAQGIEGQAGLVKSAVSSMVDGGRQAAIDELVGFANSGGRVFEDLSFRGMSDNLRKWNDSLATDFYALNRGMDWGGGGERAALQRFAAQQGGAGGAVTVRFVGDSDTAMATAFMYLIRTGKIQIGA